MGLLFLEIPRDIEIHHRVLNLHKLLRVLHLENVLQRCHPSNSFFLRC